MSKNEIDELVWRIMLENEEYEELNRIFALNGILYEGHFDKLSPKEQDDLLKRLAIGIQAFNNQIKQDIEDRHNWRKLPPIKVSGHEES